jgi:hypothetical protein
MTSINTFGVRCRRKGRRYKTESEHLLGHGPIMASLVLQDGPYLINRPTNEGQHEF